MVAVPSVSTASRYMLKLPFRRGSAEMLPVDESTSKRPGSAPSPAGTSPVGGVSLLEVSQDSFGLLSAAVESERHSSLYVYEDGVVVELAG